MDTLILMLILVVLMAVGEIQPGIVPVLSHSQLETHHHLHDGRDGSTDFSNQWIVHLDGTSDAANLLALKLGYHNLGEIVGFPNYYLMQKLDHPVSVTEESEMHTRNLEEEVRVLFAQQLFTKIREKREIPISFDGYNNDDNILDMIVIDMDTESPKGISSELLALWDQVAQEQKQPNEEDDEIVLRDDDTFNDQLWGRQWYMHDTMTRSSDHPEMDLHVMPVYATGITGKGVRVSVLDDGFDWRHPDIRENYDPEISWDYNDKDDDPTPAGAGNAHGTRCAGEIAMIANNQKCGVGIAYNANIGGIRMLDGRVTDLLEGQAMTHAIDKVDIFSASWGPSDNGKTVEGPGKMAQEALELGIKKGRNGNGTIYVWAAGNGGSKGDNVNCDGYTSSIYTLSIGSATQRGDFPWYGEKGASTMAVTFSSGSFDERKIATIDADNGCTVSHTGTSAAAPLAAGIVALALEANPKLGWRDVQHLVARTSSADPVAHNAGWKVNGAGLEYSSKFGFGVMNADRMVKLAKKYSRNVGEQLVVEKEANAESKPTAPTALKGEDPVTLSFSIGDIDIKHLEHVEVHSNIQYRRRGCLEIQLVSPKGTESQILYPRYQDDDSEKGFNNWKFMSVHMWGENPEGEWKLHVQNNGDDEECKQTREVTFGDMKLVLYGTHDQPYIVDMVSRSISNSDELVDTLEDNLSDREDIVLRQSRGDLRQNLVKINEKTSWEDLVGDMVEVREDHHYP